MNAAQRMRLAACAVVVLSAACARGASPAQAPEKTPVTDGHVVHDLGDLWNQVTNWGLIGSRFGAPTPYGDAPSGYWHGTQHLYAAGLWVGAVVAGEPRVTTGVPHTEMVPSDAPEDTIYPAYAGMPGGARYPDDGPDDDGDGAVNEDPLDGVDNDGDGAVDEDFAAIGGQHFRCAMADTGAAIQATYPDHAPLGIRVVQQSFQWSDADAADFIGYEFTIRNVGPFVLENLHCGLYSDFDVGAGIAGEEQDDQAGSWQGTVAASDGTLVPVTVAHMRDDGSVPQGGWMGWVLCGLETDAVAGGPVDPLAAGTFQRFAGQAPFGDGGDPTNDDERYQLLSAAPDRWDPDTWVPDDYRVLLGAPAVTALAPGETVTFRAALVAGEDLAALRTAAAEAVRTALGVTFDPDRVPGNGDEFTLPWVRPDEIPVAAVSGSLRAAAADGGVALAWDLRHAEGCDPAVVRRAGPGVPGRRWDAAALAAGPLRDDDPVGWPRTYDLVVRTARGATLKLDSVTLPGPADALALAAGPNPFNPRLVLHYGAPRPGRARLEVLDLAGRVVATLVDGFVPAGPATTAWDGRDARGRELASGVYLVRLTAGGRAVSERVTLLR